MIGANLQQLLQPRLCLGLLAVAVLLLVVCSSAPLQRGSHGTMRHTQLDTLNLDVLGTRAGLIRWSRQPSLCADIPYGSAHKGNLLQVWRCGSTNPNMQFMLPIGETGPIRFATHPHMCLDVLGGFTRNGNPIGLWNCGERGFHANQLFIVPTGSSGAIRWATHPQKCLDLAGGSTHNGNKIRLWDCLAGANHPNQVFTFPAGSSGFSPVSPAGPPGLPSGEIPFCGISSNVWDTPKNGNCEANMAYMRALDPQVASTIHCKEYGGHADPCSIDIHNDPDYGLGKNPSGCLKRSEHYLFFLWDEPTTHRFHPKHHCSLHGGFLPTCTEWAAHNWKRYADRWGAELAHLRSQGMKIVSPRFHGGTTLKDFAAFFQSCPECLNKASHYYIDVLAFNAWVWNSLHNNADMTGNVGWISGQAAELRARYKRPVYLGDFASIGAVRASLQADVIENSGLFGGEQGGLDGVYYFAAQDYGGGTQHNGLKELVESGPFQGQTLGQVLVRKCGR